LFLGIHKRPPIVNIDAGRRIRTAIMERCHDDQSGPVVLVVGIVIGS
jgi:hypothetical protein